MSDTVPVGFFMAGLAVGLVAFFAILVVALAVDVIRRMMGD